eukprot:5885034-Amphidinium_carterae.1
MAKHEMRFQSTVVLVTAPCVDMRAVSCTNWEASQQWKRSKWKRFNGIVRVLFRRVDVETSFVGIPS